MGCSCLWANLVPAPGVDPTANGYRPDRWDVMGYQPESVWQCGELVFHGNSMIGTSRATNFAKDQPPTSDREGCVTRLASRTIRLCRISDQSSMPGLLLMAFVSERRRFSSVRLWRADRLGLVCFRFGGSGFAAASSSASSRRLARLRLVAWERDRSSTTLTSDPSRLTIRAFK